MAKFTDDSVLDAALDDIATCVNMNICTSQPANYAAIAGASVCSVVLTAGDGNGDYTIANGDTSGRKLTVLAQSGTADGTGTVDHVCLDDGVTLKHVTTVTAQAVTNGNGFNVAAYDIEFADVTP